MKKYLVLPVLASRRLAFGTASASAQSLRIGTVDMKKIFDSYYKTKDAESKINEARNAAKKELEDRMDIAKKALDEVKKLDDEIAKPELSKEAKEQKSKVRSDKAVELQNMDREIREFQASREKQLQEQSVRMRAGIVDDINKVVADRVKAENYDLVFDKSGPSLNGVPIVLFSRDSYDFTTEVVTALNKTRGKETSAADVGRAGGRSGGDTGQVEEGGNNALTVEFTVQEIAAMVGGQLSSSGRRRKIHGAAAIAEAEEGQLTFFGNAKYLQQLKASRATAVLVPLDFAEADSGDRHSRGKPLAGLCPVTREVRADADSLRAGRPSHSGDRAGRDSGGRCFDPALCGHRRGRPDRRQYRDRRSWLYWPRGPNRPGLPVGAASDDRGALPGRGPRDYP